MKAFGILFSTGLVLAGCTTTGKESPEPTAKSAGYRIFTPRAGILVYTNDLILPAAPRITPATAAEIESLLATGRLLEAYTKLHPTGGGPGDVLWMQANAGLDRAKDMIRSQVRNRLITTAQWDPTDEQIAVLEAAMGKLFAHPDSRIGGFPSRPPYPLGSYQLVYSGIIKDGKKLIAGLARDPGREATPEEIIAAYGGDANSVRDQNSLGGSFRFPRGGFVVVYDSGTGKIVKLNFQGGM